MKLDKTSLRFFPNWLLWLAVGVGLALILIGPLLWFQVQVHKPFKGYLAQTLLIRIERGETVGEIAETLEREGVIESSLIFRLYVRMAGALLSLKAGEYKFDRPISLVDVVRKLKDGAVYLHRVTIPEGMEMAQIADIFAQAHFGTVKGFLQTMQDVSFVADLDPEAQNLEGYLFPETYSLTAELEEREIVASMVRNSRAWWTPERKQRAEYLGLTVREIVTLASLIEKETGLPRERPLVSAVFHNRLRRNMKLACDPTVIYAVKQVKEYDGVINQSDLALDSPYNTYLYAGLPPGPIANPGGLALEAALYPAESDYLFFVSRNDGSHVFSESYRDHVKAVQHYQR